MQKEKNKENIEEMKEDLLEKDQEKQKDKISEEVSEDNNLEIDLEESEDEINEEKIEEFVNKINDLSDKYQRLLAEFENFRKRSDKEKSEMFDLGMMNAINKILPVTDNFDRGISHIPEDRKDDPIIDGFTKVYDQYKEVLKTMNVIEIEALGKEFDPNLHNAVMHEEDADKGNNIIVEEFQKGYKYKDKVIRYSMVKVVN